MLRAVKCASDPCNVVRMWSVFSLMPHTSALRVKPNRAVSRSPEASGRPAASGDVGPSPWVWFLAGGLALVALAVSGLLGAFEPTAMFVVGVSTLAALVLAVRHHRPA